jgi:4'-phosphopantetheinyl transferase
MTQREVDAIRSSRQDSAREAFFRCWTRKEACLKAVGCGLSLEPSGIEVGVGSSRQRVELAYAGTLHQLDVESIDARDGVALSIAVVQPP